MFLVIRKGIGAVVVSTAVACTPQLAEDGDDGLPGADGVGIAVSLEAEPAGANCQHGGTAVKAGPDADGDGVLDADEVSTVDYVCDGAEGAGVIARMDPTAPTCPGGGVTLHAGPDTNGNEYLDAEEISTTQEVCHVQSYTAGTGLTLTGATLSVDPATIEDWARAACVDTQVEVQELLAGYDSVASDDLTSDTVFGGDVSGTASNLVLASGIVSNEHIAAGAAIDPSKISGSAWTAQNDGAGSALDADLLDGNSAEAFSLAGHDHDARYSAVAHDHDALYEHKLESTVVVHPVIGDALASGTALLAAVAGISGATADDQVLVLVEPGTYDLGAQTLTLPDFVHLVGLMQGATVITSSSAGGTIGIGHPTTDPTDYGFTVLRYLNVLNSGGLEFAIGVHVNGNVRLSVRAVTVSASDGVAGTYGIVLQGGARLNTLSDSRIFGQSAAGDGAAIICNDCSGSQQLYTTYLFASAPTGGAVVVENSGSMDMRSMVLRGGVEVRSGDLVLRDSDVQGNVVVSDDGTGALLGSVTLAHSQLWGGTRTGGVRCYGVYNESFANPNGLTGCP